jgi:phosphopantothenoylcysteine decarboxylase/phosphopantothenate--cysteine ligase
MKVLVTCGPSYEPVDRVRRLTNFSTGELGVVLSGRLAAAGCAVHCLKGDGATHPDAGAGVSTERFGTNDDLWKRLERAAAAGGVAAVFHAAALCDYRVVEVADAAARVFSSPKISSRIGALTLRLEPARKVIAGLRELFPGAWIVGWKYELEGTRAEALERGWRQLAENRTDAVVVNGAAVGPGFLACEPPGAVTPCDSKAAMADWLVGRLRARG